MAQTFNSKIKEVALAYKRLLKINIADSTLLRDIDENPFYPTLLSISDTFNRYKIKNVAFNVTHQEFGELRAPFIALLNIPDVGNDFVLVTEITDDNVSYIYSRKNTETMKKANFIDRFNNTVLFADPDENSGEKDFSVQLKKERAAKKKANFRIAAVVAIILFLVPINITSKTALAYSIISALKLSGLICASSLLANELDKNNILIKRLCGIGTKTNCNAVLDSKAARIWGISWSEIGFPAFVGVFHQQTEMPNHYAINARVNPPTHVAGKNRLIPPEFRRA